MEECCKILKLPSGHNVEYIEGEELEKLKRDFNHFEFGAVRLHPGGCLMKAQFLEIADELYNFEFRPTDVLLMSCEKSGSTWLQEIVWNMFNNQTLTRPIGYLTSFLKSPFFEFDGIFRFQENFRKHFENSKEFIDIYKIGPNFDWNSARMIDIMKIMPDPRLFRTHLTPSMINPKLLETVKIINITRNPKDVLISNHHHCCLMNFINFKGSVNDFGEHFINGGTVYLPYDEHIREFQKLKNNRNILYLSFEDLKADTFRETKRINDFLCTNLTDQQMENIIRYTTAPNMKERNEYIEKVLVYNSEVVESRGGFFRTEKDKNRHYEFSPEFQKKFNEWADVKLKDLNLPYKFKHLEKKLEINFD